MQIGLILIIRLGICRELHAGELGDLPCTFFPPPQPSSVHGQCTGSDQPGYADSRWPEGKEGEISVCVCARMCMHACMHIFCREDPHCGINWVLPVRITKLCY